MTDYRNNMAKKELTLRELKVQAISERREGRLVELPKNFFGKLQNLEKMLIKMLEEADGDVGRKERIDADMRKFLDLKLDLIKRREMKLADLAIEIVNNQDPNQNAVEQSEKRFVKEMCKIIDEHRKETMVGKTDMTYDKEEEIEKESDTEIIDVKKEREKEDSPESNGEIVDYLLIRVLDDTPTFIGMDSKSYTLEKNDIVHLPKYNARLLMDAGKIERMGKEVVEYE